MQTLAGTKNYVQWPQEVPVRDRTEWLDSQLVWPSWLVNEIYAIFRPESGGNEKKEKKKVPGEKRFTNNFFL